MTTKPSTICCVFLSILVLLVIKSKNVNSSKSSSSSSSESSTTIIVDEYMPPERLPAHRLERLLAYMSPSRNSSVVSLGKRCRDPDYIHLADMFARFVIKGLNRINMMLVPIRHRFDQKENFNGKLVVPAPTIGNN